MSDNPLIEDGIGGSSHDSVTPKALGREADNRFLLPNPFSYKEVEDASSDCDAAYMEGFNRCLEDIAELNRKDI
ncbi:MAG: hypothetical protein QFB87_04655 [Patescibacteria group bacterium]|nr:hypothetical protein [Patescibacteria group bacterium]